MEIRFDSTSILRASPSKTFSNRLCRNPEHRTQLEKSTRDDGEHEGIGNTTVSAQQHNRFAPLRVADLNCNSPSHF